MTTGGARNGLDTILIWLYVGMVEQVTSSIDNQFIMIRQKIKGDCFQNAYYRKKNNNNWLITLARSLVCTLNTNQGAHNTRRGVNLWLPRIFCTTN